MNKTIKWGLYGLSFGSILAIINFLTSDIPELSGYGIMVFRFGSMALTAPLGLMIFIIPLPINEYQALYLFLILNWTFIGMTVGKILKRKNGSRGGLADIFIVVGAMLLGAILIGGLYILYRIFSSIGTL